MAKSSPMFLNELRDSIRPETLLVCSLWVNNETGVLQDIGAIGNIVLDTNAQFFVDATQVIGKLQVDV